MKDRSPEPDKNRGLNAPGEKKNGRGKLTIFLGYAAGVGKTYAMLAAAQIRKKEKYDIVIGIVETHRFAHTNKLLAGLEVIPLRKFSNRNAVLTELDLDAVIQRAPEIVLIDDLAHTNTAGSRHTHRYQDVMELLDSSIDVYTTLNIQNLESLTDVIFQVTGVKIEEKVPDLLLEVAHEIELIDLPVDDLLARLKAGQVHRSAGEDKTFQKFFRPGNLIALREIALRRVAEHVDKQMQAYMHSHTISGPWPAGERILVCISPSPLSERLVRTTRRLAQRLDAEWIAAFVETPGHLNLSERDEDQLARTLQLADKLGAQTVRLNGDSIADTLVNYALSRNVTKIVAGKPLRPRWREWWRGSIIDQILRISKDIDLYVISGQNDQIKQAANQISEDRHAVRFPSILLAAGLVTITTLLGLPLRPFVNPTNLVMLYLVVVMVTAVWLGRRPAIMASLLSVLAFDIIFVPPYYTLVVADAEYLLTFAGLLAVGLVISTLAARAQEQALAARHRQAQTAALYDLSQGLAAVSLPVDIARICVNHIQPAFNSPAALFLPDETGKSLKLQASTPDYIPQEGGEQAADWVYQHSKPAGRHTDTMTNVNGFYYPLQTSGQVFGVMVVLFSDNSNDILTGDQQRFLKSFSNQVAAALENAQLAEQARKAHLLEETEKLQTTLLNSISHDLRTPLATITGALSSMLDDAELLSREAHHDLAQTAYEEALRLNRLVGNLLDMTRLESGAMKVVRQPYDVQDLVGSTLAHMPNRLHGRKINRIIPLGLPPISIDFALAMQAMINLVDNALKYTPVSEPIDIEAVQEGDMVVINVKDCGPGLPESELDRVFNKFFRINGDGVGGTGLGLSIAKGIVDAHNGRIWAKNRPGGGAVFSMALPVADVEALSEETPL